MVIRRARTVGAPMQVCCAVCITIHSSAQLYISMCVCVCVCIIIHTTVQLYIAVYVLLCMYVCVLLYYCVCCLSLCCVRERVSCARVCVPLCCVYVCLRARIGVLAARLLFLLLLALCVLHLYCPRSHSRKIIFTLFVVFRSRKIYYYYYFYKKTFLFYYCFCKCVELFVSYFVHFVYCGSKVGSLDNCLTIDICECEYCLCHCYYLSFC